MARVGVTGAMFVAPSGTAAPAGLAVPAAPWADAGYVSDNGLVESRNETRQTHTPWQSLTPIRTDITGSAKEFHIILWESKATSVSLYYQVPVASMVSTTAVTGPPAVPAYMSFDEPAIPAQDIRAMLFDIFDGANQRRFYCSRAEVTARGDVTYKTDTMVGYDLTITAYPGTGGIAVSRIFAEGWNATTPA